MNASEGISDSGMMNGKEVESAGLRGVETLESTEPVPASMATSPASSTPKPPIGALTAPEDVRDALRRLRDGLSRVAGDNLVGIVVYGGLARGRYRPGISDVNLIVLLRDASGPSLSAIATELRGAWRSIRADCMVLTPAEIPGVADSFPLKFLDVREHHVVLFGDDPFLRLDIPTDRIRIRVQQELRNLGLRLRRRYITISDDPVEMARAIGRAVVPLSIQLAGLLRLEGHDVPDDGVPAIFSAAAEAFHLERETLDGVQAVRVDGPAGRDLRALYDGLFRTIARTLEVADPGRDS